MAPELTLTPGLDGGTIVFRPADFTRADEPIGSFASLAEAAEAFRGAQAAVSQTRKVA